MPVFDLIFKVPYSISWRLANSRNYSFPVIFYATSLKEYELFEPIRKNLPELSIVAENRSIQEELLNNGLMSILRPVYPKVLITIKDSKYKFPSKKIIKIKINSIDFADSTLNEKRNFDDYNL